LQNDEENTEVLPLKSNKHPRAMVSMLEITGHVVVLTIHLMERSKIQTKKMARHATRGHLITRPKQPKMKS
jgi:hypothetical protein